jgi:branched-chain amino acid transport system ATP-binding protein
LSTPLGELLAPGADSSGTVLAVHEVAVRFGGVNALTDVSLTAEVGDITGLIGPNGAGKTTLFNVITGLQEPTHGRVFINGRDVSGMPTYKRARLGVARTFQRLEVFGSLTAYENVLAAAEFHRGWAEDSQPPRDVAAEVLRRVGLGSMADARVDSMPTGLARLVELGRALATRPRLLLLDEVGSGLNHDETEALGELLVSLARDGISVLLVEHDMDLVMSICDRIHVLDFGRIICTGTPTEVQQDRHVQAAYLGAESP